MIPDESTSNGIKVTVSEAENSLGLFVAHWYTWMIFASTFCLKLAGCIRMVSPLATRLCWRVGMRIGWTLEEWGSLLNRIDYVPTLPASYCHGRTIVQRVVTCPQRC